jgi:hypothetical protein
MSATTGWSPLVTCATFVPYVQSCRICLRMCTCSLRVTVQLPSCCCSSLRRDMPAGLSYEDFVAAALDTQRQLSAQSLAEVFSALDQACSSSCVPLLASTLYPFGLSCPKCSTSSSSSLIGDVVDHLLQDGDGFLTAEELTKGLKDCDIFANVDDIMQVCAAESIFVPCKDLAHEVWSQQAGLNMLTCCSWWLCMSCR